MTDHVLARDWKCPACGFTLDRHTTAQLKHCKLMIDIVMVDKRRKVFVSK